MFKFEDKVPPINSETLLHLKNMKALHSPKKRTIPKLHIDSPSVARGLRYFSTQESEVKNFNHKPLGEWLKF